VSSGGKKREKKKGRGEGRKRKILTGGTKKGCNPMHVTAESATYSAWLPRPIHGERPRGRGEKKKKEERKRRFVVNAR